MPEEIFGERYKFLPKPQILTFEEIERVARAALSLGVRKIRITGGEPLLRSDLPVLVGKLSRLDGLEDLSLTTNGYLLAKFADDLKQAGLGRITISLDSLDEQVFKRMSGRKFDVGPVLSGIDAATAAGLGPVKVNCVVKRGVNDASVANLAGHFRNTPHIVRFIEYMDVGNLNGWDMSDVVTADEILASISEHWPLEPVEPSYPGEVACRYRYTDGAGEVGVIASVTRPFCGGCTRARLAPEGSLVTCLFAEKGLDVRGPIRAGLDDAGLRDLLASVWSGRADRYSEERTAATPGRNKIEMFRIGG